jgi:hypothetical protein
MRTQGSSLRHSIFRSCLILRMFCSTTFNQKISNDLVSSHRVSHSILYAKLTIFCLLYCMPVSDLASSTKPSSLIFIYLSILLVPNRYQLSDQSYVCLHTHCFTLLGPLGFPPLFLI